ncbi:MAG: transcriptional regulator [Methanobacteriota archaeon]|nr:MAG: transcriptional regulator [Euryarchaeota archaeon]
MDFHHTTIFFLTETCSISKGFDCNHSTSHVNISTEEFRNIVLTETTSQIFITLLLYDTLNLKELAALTNKLETTTLHQIRKLLKQGIIEVDAEKSARMRGKFYRVTEQAKTAFKQLIQTGQHPISEQQEPSFDEGEDIYRSLFRKVKEVDMETIYRSSETIAKISQSIQNISLQNLNLLIDAASSFEGDEDSFIEWCKSRGIPMGEFRMAATTIPLKSASQYRKLVKELMAFQERILAMKKDFMEEEGNGNFPQFDQFVYLFSSSINKPLFEEDFD